MLKAGNSNGSLTRYQAALGYLGLGFSVIPVHTDPDRAKVSAVPWAIYQQRRATTEELHAWFIEQGYTGLALVTGAVSSLVVIDFDDRQLYRRFQRQHPDLAATYTVRTRRGVHLYFHAAQTVPSRKGQGLDLKAEGGYVVAPPTCIGDHTYMILDETAPRVLTPTDLAVLHVFLDDTLSAVPSRSTASQERVPRSPLSTDLVGHYQRLAASGSRNEALFATARRARDSGYPAAVVSDRLVETHVCQRACGSHASETPCQRRREAQATLASVYSRPPRPLVEPGRAPVQQLPNAVRERLFQMGCTHTIRVLEGLRLAGLQPGQAVTYAQMVDALAGKVGQWSIRQALAATTEDGCSILAQIPLYSPNKNANADLEQANSLTTLANGSPEKPTRSLQHRPPTRYVLPTNAVLCQTLGVLDAGSDPLTEEDLASAKQTRMAAHRELIRRRPGMYPRRWLARRLGVSTDTLDIYNRDIPIQVRHCYAEKPIGWHNLDAIPLALDLPGTFLEIETGKRYPAKREIARKLLAWKHTVVYKKQEVNFYWYADATASAPVQMALPDRAFRDPTTNMRSPTGLVSRSPNQPRRSQAVGNAFPDSTLHAAPGPRPGPARDRVAEDRLAEKVYRTVQHLSTDPAQALSKANAHQLVGAYGVSAVEQGLKRLKWYAGKGKVTRPAGFLITASRLAWREQAPQTAPGAPAPRFCGVSPRPARSPKPPER